MMVRCVLGDTDVSRSGEEDEKNLRGCPDRVSRERRSGVGAETVV